MFLKHLPGGFYYHFWTMALPKSNAGQKPDFSLLNEKQLEKIENTLRAMELFVNLAGIALGLLQYIALKHTRGVWENYAGWLRTYSSAIPSERMFRVSSELKLFRPFMIKFRIAELYRLFGIKCGTP